MVQQFDYFVILAGMRTGSNYLESSLDAYDGLVGFGEVFNPNFIGGPGKQDLLGINKSQRESDPNSLIDRLKSDATGVPGFRFFFDHDPRVLEACLKERRCAKVILTRNLLDSYISREIARETDQWRLSKAQDGRTAKIKFERSDYQKHVVKNQTFIDQIVHSLQITGQTAFQIRYDDLSNVEVLNGLAAFLGSTEVKKKVPGKTKKQNPYQLRDKVTNFQQMERDLTGLYSGKLDQDLDFEPSRGAAIPSYVPAPVSPLLFMPIACGPTQSILKWMADFDGVTSAPAEQKFNQKALRQWKRKAKYHQSFCVIRHPVVRLYDAFIRHILLPGESSYQLIRNVLIRDYGMSLPELEKAHQIDADTCGAAFLAFAKFVNFNLNGQTSVRVDAAWASQSAIVNGLAEFASPDHIFREQDLVVDLKYLASKLGKPSPEIVGEQSVSPVALVDIYDDKIEAAVKACYQRDYMIFGFERWSRDS